MAKKRKSPRNKRQPTTEYRPADPQEDVENAIKKIQEHYDLGRESLEESPERAPYGMSTEIEGPKLRLWKARKFAEAYSREDLDDLFERCREHQTALGITLLTRLVTITDRRKRKGLEGRAIRERWSKSKLDLEIRKQFGRRRHLGRKPHRPNDAGEALSELVGLCLKFCRWGEQNLGWDLETKRFRRDAYGEILDQLPDPVLGELKKALRAVSQLQTTSEDALHSFQ